MFHHVSAFFGPPLDYYDFYNFTAAKGEYENFDRNLKGTFVDILFACFAFFLYALLTCFVDVSTIYTKGFTSDSYLLQEVFIVCALGLISRLLYYSVAMVSQATIEFCGLSYIGTDSNWKSHYGRIKVVNSSYILKSDISEAIEVRL